MTGLLYKLASSCIRHRRIVVGFWIVVAIAITVFSTSVGKQFADDLTLPGMDSQEATDLVDSKFPADANGSNPILFKAKQGKITDSANRKAVEDTIDKLKKNDEVVSANDPFSKSAPGQISPDQTIAFSSVVIEDGAGDLSDATAEDLVDEAHSAAEAGDGLDVAVGGYLGQQVSKPSTESSEVVGLVVAMIVLALTFGTVVAMGLPILSALFGLGVSMGLITLLSNVATVSTVAPTLATMIGLGVGIDYALFVVTRHRVAMHEGHDPPEAAARAAATAGGPA